MEIVRLLLDRGASMEATDKVRRNVDALTYKLLGIDVCKDYFLISSILYRLGTLLFIGRQERVMWR